ncbi:MAG TPA: adenylate/guanylate cyclase domain-containing protein [Acetobacteraceae bacterium]|nr:adenylate/guanylate cyclase domain-containing protein [Acetobacteraceae bacterium]
MSHDGSRKDERSVGTLAAGLGMDRDDTRDAVGPFDPLTCPNCSTPALPMASFCSHCGTRLRGVRRLVDLTTDQHAERRQVTIVFCDLVGSSAFTAEHDVEDVAGVIRRYHATVGAVMASFGGYIARPMGDGGLFYFGYPTASEDDSKHAVDAALATIDAIANLPPQLGSRLQVRIGISSGIVVVGDVLGASDWRGSDVVGDAANLAARLQQMAKPGEILVSGSAYEMTRKLFDYEEVGPLSLRGWPEPIQAWRPLRAVAYVDRFKARLPSGTVPPLIGRAAERAALERAWEQARTGAGCVVLLIGEPGMGKSRLAHEVTHVLVPPGTAHRRYFCASMQQNVALHPFVEQLAHAAGLTGTDTPGARLDKLTNVLRGAPEEDITLLADLVVPGTSTGRPSVREASPERQRDRILGAVLASFLRDAAEAPLVLLVEDAHWIDPSSRDLLARIVIAAPGYPMLLLVTARPQFRPEWAARSDVQRLELDPLAPEDSACLVRATCEHVRLSEEIVRDIVARADGVPLFIEEVTRSILEPGVAGQPVPVSLHASLLSRIDRLGPARALAETAATIGRAFDLRLLATVCGVPEAELHPELERLVVSHFLQRSQAGGRTTYAFRHALICDATYGTVIRERRHAIHARIAETMEQQFPADAASQPQVVALHYTAAALDRKAAVWWLRAGLQSLQRSAMTEALTQLRRALALVEKLPDDVERKRIELEVLVVYGKVLMATKGHAADITGEVFVRARALCDQLGDPPQLLAVLFVQWGHAFFRALPADMQARASEILERGKQRNDDVWLVMGYYTLGFTCFLSGKNDEAMNLVRTGIGRYDPARRHLYAGPTVADPCIVMRTYLSWSLMLHGALIDAEREALTAVAEARALAQPWALALALNQEVFAMLWLRGPAAAEAPLSELERVSAGAEYYTTMASVLRGWYLSDVGDHAAGLYMARDGRSRMATAQTYLHMPHFLRQEAAMLLRMNRPDEALESIDAAGQLQRQTGQLWDESDLHRQRGDVLLALGRTGDAGDEMTIAGRLSRERGMHLFYLRAAVSLARLRATTGRRPEAVALLREARALVDGDETILDVAAADRLLAKLAVPI